MVGPEFFDLIGANQEVVGVIGSRFIEWWMTGDHCEKDDCAGEYVHLCA